MTKQIKTETPTDADLSGNPMIGGSRGVSRAGVTPDDLDDALGETTIEGDDQEGTNAEGGIDKDVAQGSRARTRP